MSVKQIVMQLGIIGAVVTFGLTLWRMLAGFRADLFESVVHAALAALGVIILALLLCGIIDKFGESAEK